MRHANKTNNLGRTAAHCDAMLSNMATSLIKHKRITTTTAKAKELRRYIEPLITRSKEDTTHSRRVVFSYLQNKFAVSELFREISQKIGNRPGGYTRILKTGFRKGDNAEMCIIELVDYNETYTASEDKKKTTKTRRGRGKVKGEVEAGKQKAEDKKAEGVKAESISEEAMAEETSAEETSAEETNVEETSDDVIPFEESSIEKIVEEQILPPIEKEEA
jgi:large subunit ribosomal protein L17